jgi:alpha-N-arabinofuranosidase
MKHLLFPILLCCIIFRVAGQNQITVNGDQGKFIINKNIYGHFAEHLGRCIYGGLYVGENNAKIPNKNGVRTDVIEALKKLKIPNLRWPGGCFADTYHWKDGIGPKEKRPSMVNVWWGGVTENNSFGTHDFLNMCELLNAEPYLSGNVGSGTVQELDEWIKYVNYKEGSGPMAILREQNGRKEPWKVRFWGVGNEAWGCGGNMKAEYYADIYRKYATFMTNWDNSSKIFRIASGASSDDYHWTEVLMKDIPKGLIEGVALHHYSVIDWNKKSSATAFTEEQYFKTMKQALRMDELIQKHIAIMDKYDPNNKVALIVDEWGGWYDVEPGTNGAFLFQQNTMRDAVLAGATLNIFHKYCERVKMANIAQVVNVLQSVILTNEEKMLLTPTYHVMEMYNVHQEATMLPIEIQTADYVVGTEKLPAVSASASKDKNGVVHISLVNVDMAKAQEITVNLKGLKAKEVTGRILSSAKVQDYNSFENPDKIKPVVFKGATLKNDILKITLPAASIVVLELK